MTCSIPEPTEPTHALPAVLTTRLQPDARRLADMTTIAVGGKVRSFENLSFEAEIIAAVTEADRSGEEVLVIGGGSNILASDADFPGVVVHDDRVSIEILSEDSCGGAQMRVTAGTPWDAVVVFAIEHGWMGLEGLSGIPGTVGAAPVQNIGAYGQEVAGTIASVRTFDRKSGTIRTFFAADLKFGYRHSILKESLLSGEWGATPRWIVLDVVFHLRRATLSEPIRYAQLAQKLGVDAGERVPASDVRSAVIELRRSKGMVLDAVDRDTFSLGSFFTNPILSEEQAAALPDDAPKYGVGKSGGANQIGAAAPQIEGQVKTSAAWLIDHAGFKPGFGMPGPAAVSTKHSLALTNRGEASASDVVSLAQTIRDGVRERFGVTLVPEPVLVNVTI
ncbi:UDP-N-acetylmuramate dehydrogenase [Arcanobacterium pluranimalium]|uniref:UDP-N-acetylmuramate dehydrogenase n=1 Tax=Arcanobacterium pluranimalium TaxID=108028 RepID=UPI00195DCFBC|nr:UDP-N-acetylmuramate dehydrogenase [Arcanobacterium pluranimalium]MBM7824904.1 UDP-N-acetylmuramate dehydrogenase [Arcanobacterium pluranimalium]